jgi:acylphosphatase
LLKYLAVGTVKSVSCAILLTKKAVVNRKKLMPNPSASQELIRAHVFISGTVQGVGYRYYTARQAQRLGVNGWVRNLSDGRVEAVFEGSRKAVEEIISWCYRGSSAAVVKDVAVEYKEPEGLQGFETRR